MLDRKTQFSSIDDFIDSSLNYLKLETFTFLSILVVTFHAQPRPELRPGS